MASFKKIRFFFNCLIFCFVVFIVAYSLFKIFHNNKTFVTDKKFMGYNTLSIHWEKNNYIVPANNILLSPNTVVQAGDFYYVEQSVLTNNTPEKCYLGFLKLQAIKKDRYVLVSSKKLSPSKLDIFSQTNSYKTMVSLYNEKDYLEQKHILNCQNWVKLTNSKKNVGSKNGTKKTLNVIVDKCFRISSKKYLAIESTNSNVLFLELNEISDNINLCAKSFGFSLIHFYPRDGSSPFTITAQVLPKRGKIEKIIKKTSSNFLSKKTLAGWRE